MKITKPKEEKIILRELARNQPFITFYYTNKLHCFVLDSGQPSINWEDTVDLIYCFCLETHEQTWLLSTELGTPVETEIIFP